MKTFFKFMLIISVINYSNECNSQNSDQESVSVTLDLKPILQLEMSSPDQIDFVFDKDKQYHDGIVKNAATTIKITSTVKWDLYAIGRNKEKNPNRKTYWSQENMNDANITSLTNIPLNLLEIKQHTPNNGINYKQSLDKDYSQDFSIADNLNGRNNIYVSKDGSLSPPSINDKYIAGHAGSSSDIKNGYMNPGSYNSKNMINNFEYVLDYRILPNIPLLFSNSENYNKSTISKNSHMKNNSLEHLTNHKSSSESNRNRTKFSMNIVYVLLEDQ